MFITLTVNLWLPWARLHWNSSAEHSWSLINAICLQKCGHSLHGL